MTCGRLGSPKSRLGKEINVQEVVRECPWDQHLRESAEGDRIVQREELSCSAGLATALA